MGILSGLAPFLLGVFVGVATIYFSQLGVSTVMNLKGREKINR